VASATEVLDALDGAVAEVLEEVGGLFRDLAYDRLRLSAWLADLLEAGAGPAVVFQAVQMLIGLVDVEPDREIRYRTLIESFMSLPGPVQGAVLADHLVPAVRADLGLLRLLTRFSADELAELVALVPAAVLEALRAEIEALPTEEWKKSRLSESLEEALAEKDVAATPLEPLIADDDPELSRLREMILAACPPPHVLGHSTRVLFHLFGETESEAYPSFLVDSLEEAIGEALEGDQLPLALRILQWLRQPERFRPEWEPEHQRRLKLLSQRLAERSRVARLVEHLRRRDDPSSIAAVAEYLRSAAAQAIDEFVDRFAGEPPGEVRSRLLEVLAALGPVAAPAMRARVNDARWMVAQSAIALLTRIGDGDSVPAIAKATGHPHPQVRAEAARALVALVPRQAPRRLLECLDDADADVRRAALGGLRTLAEAGSVTPIRDYLASPTRTVAALLVKRDLIAGLASVARPEARQCLELIARRRVWLWQGTERKVRALARQALLGAPEGRPLAPPGPRAGRGGPGPESP
jgi:HEAT repeat protein